MTVHSDVLNAREVKRANPRPDKGWWPARLVFQRGDLVLHVPYMLWGAEWLQNVKYLGSY